MAVNTASLRKLIKEFPFEPMAVVTLGPGENADAADAANASA